MIKIFDEYFNNEIFNHKTNKLNKYNEQISFQNEHWMCIHFSTELNTFLQSPVTSQTQLIQSLAPRIS